MTEEEIRSHIEQQWREALIAEEARKIVPFDPVLLGQRVAAALADHREEIEEEIACEIESVRNRGRLDQSPRH
jgi:hypothetical protein